MTPGYKNTDALRMGVTGWRQDAVDKRSNGHGRVNLIISGYRGGLDTYIRDPHHQATHSVTTLSYTCLLMMTRGSTTSAGTQDQFCQ